MRKLIQSIVTTLEEVIPADVTGQVQKLYKDCLTKTITIASEDVDKLIGKYHVTKELEVEIFRDRITMLWDNAGIILNQD